MIFLIPAALVLSAAFFAVAKPRRTRPWRIRSRRKGRKLGKGRKLNQGRGLDQRGEGVISAAIAVLIIASLGALMWVGFKSLWENAEATTNSEISKIGQ